MTETNKNLSAPNFSIGQLIEAELKRQNLTVTWLSRQIHCDRRNIYDIFHRDNIDTTLLFKISRALGYNFFTHFSEALADSYEQ